MSERRDDLAQSFVAVVVPGLVAALQPPPTAVALAVGGALVKEGASGALTHLSRRRKAKRAKRFDEMLQYLCEVMEFEGLADVRLAKLLSMPKVEDAVEEQLENWLGAVSDAALPALVRLLATRLLHAKEGRVRPIHRWLGRCLMDFTERMFIDAAEIFSGTGQRSQGAIDVWRIHTGNRETMVAQVACEMMPGVGVVPDFGISVSSWSGWKDVFVALRSHGIGVSDQLSILEVRPADLDVLELVLGTPPFVSDEA